MTRFFFFIYIKIRIFSYIHCHTCQETLNRKSAIREASDILTRTTYWGLGLPPLWSHPRREPAVSCLQNGSQSVHHQKNIFKFCHFCQFKWTFTYFCDKYKITFPCIAKFYSTTLKASFVKAAIEKTSNISICVPHLSILLIILHSMSGFFFSPL